LSPAEEGAAAAGVLRVEVEKLRGAVAAADAEEARLRKQVMRLSEEVSDGVRRVADLEGLVKEAGQREKDAKSRAEGLGKELAASEKGKRESEGKREALEIKAKGLEGEVSRLGKVDAECGRLRGEVEALRLGVEKERQRAEGEAEAKSELRRSMEQVQARLREVEEEREISDSRGQQLKKEGRDRQVEAEGLKGRIAGLEEELSGVKVRMGEVEKRGNHMRAEIERARGLTIRMRDALCSHAASISAGIGLVVRCEGGNKGPTVKAVSSGGAAERSGLVKIGDTLLKVDNHPVLGMTSREVSSRILGAPGTQVELRLQRGSDPKHTVTLVRGEGQGGELETPRDVVIDAEAVGGDP
jgi:predicted  nucleic acid-binding Zn-ribbon protein